MILRHTPLAALLAGVALLSLSSCGLLPTVCPSDFGVEVRPAGRVLAVGEEFTAEALALTCGGRNRAPYGAAWSSSDPSVASVDPGTGRVVGISPGRARIRAHETEGAEWWWGEVDVTVTQ
jgi:hypothetical protein